MHAQWLQQLVAGKALYIGGMATHSIADDCRDNQRIAAGVLPYATGFRRQCGLPGIAGHVVAVLEQHFRHRIESAVAFGQIQTAGHAQQLIKRNRVARVGRIAPCTYGRRRNRLQLSFAYQDADQGVDDRLACRVPQ
jgi:hypothetical protein